MKESAPEHIEKYCYKDEKDALFCELQERYHDEYTFIYKIKCECGETHFEVYEDKHPSVFLKCINCHREITAYDLAYYPAATKLKDKFEKEKIYIGNIENFNVYALYQYDNEFELEDDVEFDKNDISWGNIYIKNEDIINKILDDETT